MKNRKVMSDISAWQYHIGEKETGRRFLFLFIF